MSKEKINFKINFDSNVEEISLEKHAEVAIYRVIQEFINNSIKHSGAENINIIFNQTKTKLKITISDDGKGFKISPNTGRDGRGLNTMRSRIETFGGKFVLLSKPGAGVTLKITFI